ncbi:MAG: flagellar assembly protein H, partial [Gammaproteobacteria bacterium]|nr:flagellar assembly protein H [Gammaproteobacteria bacterium]
GREEGEAKGIEETTKKIAFRLFENNISDDDIIKFTGLSQEEIQAFRQLYNDSKT